MTTRSAFTFVKSSPWVSAAALLMVLALVAIALLQVRSFAPAPPAYEPAAASAEAVQGPEAQALAPTRAAADTVLDGRLEVNSLLAPDRALEHGDYAWNDEGVAGGPLLIVVDVEREMLHVFRGGVEIGRSVVLYGADDKPTPLGEFTITEKKVDHISNLYGAPMPFMMRLTNDGVAIHGSEVESGYATHGCVGVPTEFAELLFNIAKLGDRVIVTKGSDLSELTDQTV